MPFLSKFSPSRTAGLIAYQQLIRDTARKFPGMAWYVYDVEFSLSTGGTACPIISRHLYRPPQFWLPDL